MFAPDFALHLTWTCYGNWLPGDARGYVSNTLQNDRTYREKENVPQSAYTADNPDTLERSRRLMEDSPVRLTAKQSRIVVDTLIQAAAKRGWHIGRAAVMSNHVHVVIWNCPNNGPDVRRVLKGVTQAALSDHHGSSRRWWTAGGSDRYKNDSEAVHAALEYVMNQEWKLAEIVDMKPCVPDE